MCIWICICIWLCVCINVCMYVCMYVCIYIYIYIHIYIYISLSFYTCARANEQQYPVDLWVQIVLAAESAEAGPGVVCSRSHDGLSRLYLVPWPAVDFCRLAVAGALGQSFTGAREYPSPGRSGGDRSRAYQTCAVRGSRASGLPPLLSGARLARLLVVGCCRGFPRRARWFSGHV